MLFYRLIIRCLAMRNLLIVTAMTELGAGFALLCSPSAAVVFLAGMALEGPAVLTVARIAGGSLFALGVACWIASDDIQSRAARGLVAAMLIYDVDAVVVLAYAGIGFGLQGVALWPGVILHSAMSVWCVTCLCSRRGT